MDEYDIKRLGLIIALQVEVEGMKTANKERQSYNASSFLDIAEEIRIIVYKAKEEL